MTDQTKGSMEGMPTWVKVSLVLVLIMVLIIGGVLLLGGGQHGPSRHQAPSGRTGTTSSSIAPGANSSGIPGSEGGHTLPEGGHQ